jgi:hypothetical protein
MGNVSPRQSKSHHDGFTNHLNLSSTTITPNRSSWKKQLQLINETLNIKKISLRRTHGKSKCYRSTFDENNHHSLSTHNFHDLIKNNPEKAERKYSQNKLERHSIVKKSFSLFSIKQASTDSTNKENLPNSGNTIKEKEDQQPLSSITNHCNNIVIQENETVNTLVQQRRRPKFEITTGEY